MVKKVMPLFTPSLLQSKKGMVKRVIRSIPKGVEVSRGKGDTFLGYG